MAERAAAGGAVNDGGQAARVGPGRDAAPDKGGFDQAMAKARSDSAAGSEARGKASAAAPKGPPDKAGLVLGSTLTAPAWLAPAGEAALTNLGRAGAVAMGVGAAVLGGVILSLTSTSTAPREMDERPENFQHLPAEKAKEPSEADKNREESRAKGIPDSAIGNSGKPKRHEVQSPNKKAAKDAARQAGKGEPMHHPSPTKGSPHYHPTDQHGNKMREHYSYPRNK